MLHPNSGSPLVPSVTPHRRRFLALSALTGAGAWLTLRTLGALPPLAAFAGETAGRSGPSPAALQEVVRTADECIRTGEACLKHCEAEQAKGNHGMDECAVKVRDVLALTRALRDLAKTGSPHAARLASVSADACRQCADVCAKHSGMKVCVDCRDACLTCEKACRAISA